jgi:hypothetical protein
MVEFDENPYLAARAVLQKRIDRGAAALLRLRHFHHGAKLRRQGRERRILLRLFLDEGDSAQRLVTNRQL